MRSLKNSRAMAVTVYGRGGYLLNNIQHMYSIKVSSSLFVRAC